MYTQETTKRPFSIAVKRAVEDLSKAQARFNDVMCTLSTYDLEAAINEAGYSGTNMRPLTATYVRDVVTTTQLGLTRQWIYECTWADDGTYNDEEFVNGKLFVWQQEGTLLADFAG